jgi:dihydroorotate dehydrogenase (NAD+) catalytic subunit
MVHQVYAATGADIIGLGGIACAEDALKFILAGARAVSVGTMNFVRPDWSARLPIEIARRASELGAASIDDLVGKLKA